MTHTIDWYEATIECETSTLMALFDILHTDEHNPETTYGRGRHGYKRRITMTSDLMEMTILDTGNGGWPHIVGSGASANKVSRLARATGAIGRVTRIDIANDTIEHWEDAERRVQQWANDHPKTTIISVGDFHRGEKGRTYYLGATTSEKRIRVYEKGIQLDEDPLWIRTELQYRPKTKAAKTWAFHQTAETIANSSKAFIEVRKDDGFYTPPNYVRARREPIIALAHQYGRALREHVPAAYHEIIAYLRHDWRPEDD